MQKQNVCTPKKILQACLAALLVTTASGLAQHPKRILFFGDSITAEGGWIRILEEQLNIEAINAGKPGRKAVQAVEHLPQYLTDYPKPDLIVMFLGVNDLPARDTRPGDVKVAGCVTNMSRAIDLALQQVEPQQIVLVAPCGVNPQTMSEMNLKKGYQITQPLLEKLEEGYKALAQGKGTEFLSLLNTVSSENYKDGLHPNPDGNAQIAEAFLDFYKQRQPTMLKK